VSATPARPIGPYARGPASVRPWDPRSGAVADRVIEIIQRARPELVVEHIGSSAVPGLPGKGIIDLGTEADPADIPAITQAMYGLGFGPQPGPDAWPATRPMHVGSIEDGGATYLVHFHVHPRGTGDLDKDLRFRDALRDDQELRDGYARIKTQIVGPAGVAADRARYQAEKGDWILQAFDRLGIPRPANTQFAAGAGPTHPPSTDTAGGAA
jgi:GrpB-like predicted nucleotidyltransferase (UPF0157 family)